MSARKKIVRVRELRSNLGELLDGVADRRDHVVVTRKGRPAAALVPFDEYEALEKTADILSGPGDLEAIQAGLGELARHEALSLEDLRAELAELRQTR